VSHPLRILSAAPGDERTVLVALAAALDGTGPPIAPLRPSTQGPSALEARHDHVPGDVVLAVTTSGSTASPRTVLLTRGALEASAAAAARRLGGTAARRDSAQRLDSTAQWLLALPVHHIAGLQVLTRSALAGTEPVILDLTDGFTGEAFAAATARLTGQRRYTSLVPTQLRRILASPAGTEALASFDAVLVGGAATDPGQVRAAGAAGATLVRTYGMTETSGGCVYDGLPLDGVTVELDEDGRILLAGPVLAAGYLADPELTNRTFVTRAGVRWLRTDDLGTFDDDDALRVLGRVDDVINTGGVKVAPTAVEAALSELEAVAQACVVGVPDPEWGAAVVAVVVLAHGASASDLPLDAVREHVALSLGAPAAPRRIVVVRELPELGPGKLDRRAVRRIAAAAVSDPATGTLRR